MNTLKTFMPLISAIISFCFVFVALGLVFNMLLGPVERDIEDLKKGQVEMKTDIKEIKNLLNRQAETKTANAGKNTDQSKG